ncbi:hypothetical protein LOK49_LG02G02250 [Camellia lanceoleosa]|uniref:Uncharacterized protein n=1 Tax=Camellia lanceoleosa TaxID=1840588 RepID=A0ACC0IRP2_9ERIC|nr:hypothetical protein LOK49_LG02G02250 [Camellia lanceoleosa]
MASKRFLDMRTRNFASQIAFSISEVEALFEMYKSISSYVIDDGLINKWEAGKRYIKFQLSTKAMKTVKKNGLDAVAKKAGSDLHKE